jgi:hypothetical protein
MLRDLPSPQPQAVRALLDRYAIGCVVLLEEDRLLNTRWRKSMPPDFDDPTSPLFLDPWARYRDAAIEIIDTTTTGPDSLNS